MACASVEQQFSITFHSFKKRFPHSGIFSTKYTLHQWKVAWQGFIAHHQSSEALTFTSIFPGWQLYEPFHLHSTLPITSRKQEGGRGRDGGRGNVRQWPWWGEEGRQVTSQWYHGISSSTWPAPAASWAAAYYNSRHLSRSSSCWTLQPMANDQYNVCSTSYEAAAIQCTMAITYIVRRRKGLCTTKIQPRDMQCVQKRNLALRTWGQRVL